ncbi:MAG: hypothetical protein AAGI06_14270 [Pseudomonadota bacterium]
MPHFRTWDSTIYDFHQEVDDGTFDFVDIPAGDDQPGNDPEQETIVIILMNKHQDPSSPYEEKGETPPMNDQAAHESLGDNVFGFEDLIGI